MLAKKGVSSSHLPRALATVSRFKFGGKIKETSYENYNKTAEHYDNFRRAVATRPILDSMRKLKAAKKQPIKVLDAGCGTGNYIQFMVDQGGAKDVCGLEVNEGMYRAAKEKMRGEKGVKITNDSILNSLELYGRNTFDLIVVNQVIHHLDTDQSRENDYYHIREAFKQLFELLREGGILCLNHSPFVQHGYSYWMYHFMPAARVRVSSRFPRRQWTMNNLVKSGFDEDSIETVVCRDAFFDEKVLYNLAGVFEEDWRQAISIWSLVTDDELAHCQAGVKELLEDDEERKLFLDMDRALIDNFGVSTTFVAQKY